MNTKGVTIVMDIGGRDVVLRDGLWFYVDSEVVPGSPDASEHDGHWYPLGSGVAVPPVG